MSELSAEEALQRLREGNQRFVDNVRSLDAMLSHSRRDGVVTDQSPIAVILGCSDSRVPAEIVFDQGLGDLFVIRVAGNIVAPSQVGSVEFAVSQFGTKLVVVMGHSHCGAVSATLEQLTDPQQHHSENIRSIVERIRPSVEVLLETELRNDKEALLEQAVRANVRTAANQLRHGSALLEKLIEEEGVKIVGAEYSLESGVVDFFDGI